MRVAVVGLGSLGSPIARRVLTSGHDLTVFDVRASATEPLAALGARVVGRPSDCLDTDVIAVLVHDSDQVLDVVAGPGGITSSVVGDSPPVVLIMSTVPPATVRSVAELLAARGIAVLDAPVSGGPKRAADGELAIILGGDVEQIERVRPFLSSIGSEIFVVGGVGAAQTVKVVNNALCASTTLVMAEALQLAREAGLSFEVATRVMEAGTGRNFLTEPGQDPAEFYSMWTQQRAGFESVRTTLLKDVDIALDLLSGQRSLYPALTYLSDALTSLSDSSFYQWRSVGEGPSTSPSPGSVPALGLDDSKPLN